MKGVLKYEYVTINLFECMAWERAYFKSLFKLGNLLSAETQLNSLPNLKYSISFYSCNNSNRLMKNLLLHGMEPNDGPQI